MSTAIATPIMATPITAIRTIETRAVAPRLRITPRGRAVLTAVAAFPLVLGAVFITTNGGGATATDQLSTVSFDHVTIQAGQTLWQLAEDLAPAADPRDVVSQIVNLNNLQSGDIQAGQELAIPTQYSR